MLRIFKPRSPMSMGAWCLTAFGDRRRRRGRRRPARAAAATAQRARRAPTRSLGGYLGSYTGVLLASTAVPGVGAQPRSSSARSSSAPRPPPAPPPPGSCWRRPGSAAAIRRAARSARSRPARCWPSWRCRRSTSAGSGASATRSRGHGGPAARHGEGARRRRAWRCACSARRLAARPARGQRPVPRRRARLPLRVGRGRQGLGPRRRGRRADGAPARSPHRTATEHRPPRGFPADAGRCAPGARAVGRTSLAVERLLRRYRRRLEGRKPAGSPVWWSYRNDHTGDTMGYRN